jgi:hypothetical protein
MNIRKAQKEKLREAAQRGATLTTAEASGLTGYSQDHIGLMIRKGTLRGAKRGRDWFVDAGSLFTYVVSTPRPGRRGTS